MRVPGERCSAGSGAGSGLNYYSLVAYSPSSFNDPTLEKHGLRKSRVQEGVAVLAVVVGGGKEQEQEQEKEQESIYE